MREMAAALAAGGSGALDPSDPAATAAAAATPGGSGENCCSLRPCTAAVVLLSHMGLQGWGGVRRLRVWGTCCCVHLALCVGSGYEQSEMDATF
jgi:hypothetical protein